jgi:hypothetical protein
LTSFHIIEAGEMLVFLWLEAAHQYSIYYRLSIINLENLESIIIASILSGYEITTKFNSGIDQALATMLPELCSSACEVIRHISP